MTFQPADYVVGGVIILLALMGLFRGLSGALAFLAGLALSAAVAMFGWRFSADLFEEPWLRGLVVFGGTILAFGLVRFLVKKLVNGLLSQPSDSIFGFLVGAAVGFFLLVAWSWTGFYTEISTLASELAPYVQRADSVPAINEL